MTAIRRLARQKVFTSTLARSAAIRACARVPVITWQTLAARERAIGSGATVGRHPSIDRGSTIIHRARVCIASVAGDGAQAPWGTDLAQWTLTISFTAKWHGRIAPDLDATCEERHTAAQYPTELHQNVTFATKLPGLGEASNRAARRAEDRAGLPK
jgi:hypothetical protein